MNRQSVAGRAILDSQTIQIPDAETLDGEEWAVARQLAQEIGLRSILVAPLLREGTAIGAISLRRPQPGAFTQRQIELLETFAAQAAIAIENVRLFTGQREALEQQTATTEVLGVINASPGNLDPVFDAMLEKSMHLCEAAFGIFMEYDGDLAHASAFRGLADDIIAGLPASFRPDTGGRLAQALNSGVVVQVADISDSDSYRAGQTGAKALVDVAGAKTVVWVPLRRDNASLGCVVLYRREVRAFSDKQVALLQNFAAQAVIAMENARLLTEQREALEQQTATAEILRVISQSPTDVRPVLDAVAEAAVRFCGADDALVIMREGDELAWIAHDGPLPVDMNRRVPIDRGTINGRAILDATTMHVPDVAQLDRDEFAMAHAISSQHGVYAALAAPLLRDGAGIGCILLRKKEASAFAPRQIALLETFAAQAVIAIENVRLFTELRESLDQQTATTEVLKVISESPTDVEPVLKAVVAAAQRFCGAEDAAIIMQQGDRAAFAAHVGPLGGDIGNLVELDRTSVMGRAILDNLTIHMPDALETDPVEFARARRLAQTLGFRAAVAAPMLREGVAIGCVLLRKAAAGAYTPRQIELAEAFAAQAVIAIQNVRLFTELKESLEQQTATGEILQVISQSPTDVSPVLEAVVKAAVRFCGAQDAIVMMRGADELVTVAHEGPMHTVVGTRRPHDASTAPGRAIVEARTIHYPDYDALDPVAQAPAREYGRIGGFNAALAAPMMRDGAPIGAIALRRAEAGAFTDRQIALLESFAAQAVIAIENVRLFTEQRELLEQQTATAEILRVISQSPTDVQPVFDAIAASALKLLKGWSIIAWRYEGGRLHPASVKGGHPGSAEALPGLLKDLSPDDIFVGAAIRKGAVQQVVDAEAASVDPGLRELARVRGWRSNLAVPMIREGQPVGVIALSRTEPGTFSEREVSVLQSFAAQAVIALENTRLFTELQERNAAVTTALERQTATAEILRVISQSPTDVQPVFDAIAASAVRLCDALHCALYRYDGTLQHLAADHGVDAETLEILRATYPRDPNPETVTGVALLEGETVHIADLRADDRFSNPTSATVAAGYRAALAVPMLKDGQPIGVIFVVRREPLPYSDRQVELLETFAAQAVIAIENVRLFTELKEALQQQTATAEILRVINSSPGNLTPVFEAILEKAHSSCGADMGSLFLWDGTHARAIVTMGYPDEVDAILRQKRPPVPWMVELLNGRRFYHHANVQERVREGPHPMGPTFVSGSGIATNLIVPLRKDDKVLGFISANRRAVRPYTDKEISLLENFAAQAVIAMENARLLTELRESLEQQTATADILRVISQSPTDVQPVLDTVVKSALRFCGTTDALINLRDGDEVIVAAHEGPLTAQLHSRRPFERSFSAGRAMSDGRTIHFRDVSELDPQEFSTTLALAREHGFKASVAAPLMREGVGIGAIVLRKTEVGEFTPRQIGLLESFAAQAVIAIENVRLFTELRKRTDDLTESLDYQTATSELLEVISRSATDIQPVLDTMLASASRLCGAELGGVAVRRGEQLHFAATLGAMPAFDRFLRETPHAIDRHSLVGRAAFEKAVVHIPDLETDSEYAIPDRGNWRAALGVPLLRDGEVVGAIALTRKQAEPFTDRQIALVKTFADQAVIAMENARLLSELRESLDQQTAMADVLQVISRSPGDPQPVFEAMLDKAMSLCQASFGMLASFDGKVQTQLAMRAASDVVAHMFSQPIPIEPESAMGRLARSSESAIQVLDAKEDEAYRTGVPSRVKFVDTTGARTALWVALRKDGQLVGAFIFYRHEVRAFDDKQIALLKAFADQAVIAMENARLLGELTRREEELRATFDHMGDGVVMFDADLNLASWNRNFQELLDVPDSFLATRPGLDDYVRLLVQRGEVGQGNPDEEVARFRERASQAWSTERTRPDGRILEVRNNPVPGGGAVLIYSDATERKQAESEIRSARDAAEAALERQTATADILKVIASSPTDVQPVLDAVARAAVQFCGTTDALVQLKDGDSAVAVAHEGPLQGVTGGRRRAIKEDTYLSATMLEGRTVHYPDVQALEGAEFAGVRQIGADVGFRAVLGAPLLREGAPLGAIALRRIEPGPFTPQQIELLETFAAQAVIAIENVRLFTEQRELLEQQTATADILKVIAGSPTDVQPVLDVVARAAIRFCGATDTVIHMREGNDAITAAHEGALPAERGRRIPLSRETGFGAAILDASTIHRPDIWALDPVEFATAHRLSRELGFRAVLVVPLMREGTAIGSISLRRGEAGAFTQQQIELLETFAAQAVIAVENVRLFTELRDSLERLKAAQANLVQSEKMASLGQLTAGIAHEIKNPLNFVNNFATLSVDLIDELKQVAGPALATLDADRRAELDETMQLLVGNLAKINEHGKRADGIVRSMLSHSRGGTGDWTPSDINALVEEAMNLAYHGARAQDKEFNVTLERDLDKSGAPIEVVPQDVTRVFLNLIGNGFYAANKRRLGEKQSGFRPTLKVSTRDLGEQVEIRVRDNGTGIPPEAREKLFQPFFTTKPTGEGTGLGLSISYDIVTQQHGGTIEVESEPGQYTEFTVRLPRARRVAEARGA